MEHNTLKNIKFNKINIIAGTSTDVGKTHLTCEFIKYLNSKSKNIFGIKPIISGVNSENIHDSDNAKLLYAMNLGYTIEAAQGLSRYILHGAYSPNIAAHLEGNKIEYSKILSFCTQYCDQNFDHLFIETAGGVMSSIADNETNLDLLCDLKNIYGQSVSVFLVTKSYLGTISHTLTALKSFRFDITIMNMFGGAPSDTGNMEIQTIEKISKTPVIVY